MTISRASNSGLYTVNTGVVGFGNWASVTGTTGSPTTGTYTDANGVSWKFYRWASSGSVTTTAGIADILVVGGGGGTSARGGGGAGAVRYGAFVFTSATHTVTVGGGGASGTPVGSNGSDSLIGTVLRSGGGSAGYGDTQTSGAFGPPNGGGSGGGVQFSTWGGYVVGAGAGGSSWGGTQNGLPLSITGTSVEYGKTVYAAVGDTPGSGGCAASGANGVVILRVPSTFALA